MTSSHRRHILRSNNNRHKAIVEPQWRNKSILASYTGWNIFSYTTSSSRDVLSTNRGHSGNEASFVLPFDLREARDVRTSSFNSVLREVREAEARGRTGIHKIIAHVGIRITFSMRAHVCHKRLHTIEGSEMYIGHGDDATWASERASEGEHWNVRAEHTSRYYQSWISLLLRSANEIAAAWWPDVEYRADLRHRGYIPEAYRGKWDGNLLGPFPTQTYYIYISSCTNVKRYIKSNVYTYTIYIYSYSLFILFHERKSFMNYALWSQESLGAFSIAG